MKSLADLIYGQLTSKVDQKRRTLRTVKCMGKCDDQLQLQNTSQVVCR